MPRPLHLPTQREKSDERRQKHTFSHFLHFTLHPSLLKTHSKATLWAAFPLSKTTNYLFGKCER